MKKTVMYGLSFAGSGAAMLVVGLPLFASNNDDRIEESFQNTYIYKTYLKDDAVKASAQDGVVTLTGTVSEESHKVMAQVTAANLPGVTGVNNRMTVKKANNAIFPE